MQSTAGSRTMWTGSVLVLAFAPLPRANMITDLSGGLDPDLEYFLPERPVHPQMRDSATLWLMDEDGSLAFPRVTIDAIGSHWDRPWLQMNLVLSDGRALRLWDQF